MPTVDEIAALIVGGDHGREEERDIIVRKIDGNLLQIYETYPPYMRLQYPLLFPYGTDGWLLNIPCGERIKQQSETCDNERICCVPHTI